MKREHGGRPEGGVGTLRLALVWAALLLLMLGSLGTAYLKLGALGNLAAGLAIALVKTALVVAVFMGFGRSALPARLVSGAALFLLSTGIALSAVDYLTRIDEHVIVQPPAQLDRILPAPGTPR